MEANAARGTWVGTASKAILTILLTAKLNLKCTIPQVNGAAGAQTTFRATKKRKKKNVNER